MTVLASPTIETTSSPTSPCICHSSARSSAGTFHIRKDFLGPLIAARPKTLRRAAVGEKTGAPLGVSGKRPNFLRNLGGGGGLKTRHKESPVRKGRFGGGFSDLRVLQNTGVYCLLSLGDG